MIVECLAFRKDTEGGELTGLHNIKYERNDDAYHDRSTPTALRFEPPHSDCEEAHVES